MNAAICIDSWKLTIFKRRLTQAGYSYTEHPGLTRDMLILRVEYTDQAALLVVVKAANTEAAKVSQRDA